MPNYDFKCLECKHEFQALLPAGAGAAKCLECGHPEARKQLTAPGVRFVGEGFYKTDSRKTEIKSSEAPKPSASPPPSDDAGD